MHWCWRQGDCNKLYMSKEPLANVPGSPFELSPAQAGALMQWFPLTSIIGIWAEFLDSVYAHISAYVCTMYKESR